MKILFIGDIVAKPGRKTVEKVLPTLKSSDNIGLVLANAENLAHGRGITESVISEMLSVGVDYFTGGDHLFWQKGTEDVIDKLPIIRPANYPKETIGKGYALIDLPGKGSVLLINLLGRAFFNLSADDPFEAVDLILKEHEDKKPSIIIVDFHAEATSEKMAMGFYLDGRVTAVVGTHTHVPTCDNFVLPKGTMYVTDIGMTGVIDSVLGVKKDIIIKQMRTAINQKFEWEEEGRCAFRSVLLDTDKKEILRVDQNLF
ncbi:hypothetical protein A2716_04240 [candidate division WWE3 bacterium RIFCSPHIGHO2_01_FULL_40_23]|uniref:Metallophosphoesterase n=1 Tax=candidate division WWE3 bacterium RIFCSPLOWO2_01_FULL_41_18 TaxID=1802625 RepID=A0A1F4VD67_UNCKA|nr:MAG: hypothetical protein A2716_04240 [candidate division WWE3 bacterium RIFCSPHIGHO2_01_FULL_40_23]OGC55084.1 MAG: hypothetical protein A3A78_03850 [candidate division WWE3 bacterium RIFCSPLOWO2_01_FULL_41_18]